MAIAVQEDGKILIGGAFAEVDAARATRSPGCWTDGTLDPELRSRCRGAGVAKWPNAMELQPDGKILIGGRFWRPVNGMARKRIARLLPDGALDASFDPGIRRKLHGLCRNVAAGRPGAHRRRIRYGWRRLTARHRAAVGRSAGLPAANIASLRAPVVGNPPAEHEKAPQGLESERLRIRAAEAASQLQTGGLQPPTLSFRRGVCNPRLARLLKTPVVGNPPSEHDKAPQGLESERLRIRAAEAASQLQTGVCNPRLARSPS